MIIQSVAKTSVINAEHVLMCRGGI
jgi:hypothetical protein